jgi:hypothetical protein
MDMVDGIQTPMQKQAVATAEAIAEKYKFTMEDFNMKDMNAIKENRDKFFDSIGKGLNDFGNAFVDYVRTISNNTLNIASVVVLHCVFVPATIAYLTGITERLPSIDSVLLVLLALTIMAANALVKNDRLAILTHMLGFISNSVLLSMVIFK